MICFEKSFANNDKSRFIVDKTINCLLVFNGSDSRHDFKCNECSHIFNMYIYSIKSGSWCPYCSKQIMCKDKECICCFNKSFASIKKSKYLVDKTIDVKAIFKFTQQNHEFSCKTCKHSFIMRIDHVSNGHWCPYCSTPPKKICGKCTFCVNKSFSIHPNSKYLVDKTINTKLIFRHSNQKQLFKCKKCENEFEMKISKVYNGQWCPLCLYKTESKLYEFIIKNISQTCQRQKKFEWCKKINHLPFDFYIEELKLIIELDGPQHFKQVGKWKDPKITLENDIYKMTSALENQISMIRILQDDIYYNKNNWDSFLIKNTVKYKIPTIIFLENDNEYFYHKLSINF